RGGAGARAVASAGRCGGGRLDSAELQRGGSGAARRHRRARGEDGARGAAVVLREASAHGREARGGGHSTAGEVVRQAPAGLGRRGPEVGRLVLFGRSRMSARFTLIETPL